jgi:hypothetical protein
MGKREDKENVENKEKECLGRNVHWVRVQMILVVG